MQWTARLRFYFVADYRPRALLLVDLQTLDEKVLLLWEGKYLKSFQKFSVKANFDIWCKFKGHTHLRKDAFILSFISNPIINFISFNSFYSCATVFLFDKGKFII